MIGLNPEGKDWLFPLGIGTILPVFHSDGKTPVVIERLKSSVREGVMLSAVHLSIFAEISSCPVDLEVSSAA